MLISARLVPTSTQFAGVAAACRRPADVVMRSVSSDEAASDESLASSVLPLTQLLRDRKVPPTGRNVSASLLARSALERNVHDAVGGLPERAAALTREIRRSDDALVRAGVAPPANAAAVNHRLRQGTQRSQDTEELRRQRVGYRMQFFSDPTSTKRATDRALEKPTTARSASRASSAAAIETAYRLRTVARSARGTDSRKTSRNASESSSDAQQHHRRGSAVLAVPSDTKRQPRGPSPSRASCSPKHQRSVAAAEAARTWWDQLVPAVALKSDRNEPSTSGQGLTELDLRAISLAALTAWLATV
jgi:hypothetical protein